MSYQSVQLLEIAREIRFRLPTVGKTLTRVDLFVCSSRGKGAEKNVHRFQISALEIE